MAALAGQLVGALLATLVVSRLILMCIPRTMSPAVRVGLANGLSVALAVTLSAFGHADGGSLNWGYSGLYVVAQLVWLFVDVIRQDVSQFRATARTSEDGRPSASLPGIREPTPGEVTYWQSISGSNDANDFIAYLKQFP